MEWRGIEPLSPWGEPAKEYGKNYGVRIGTEWRAVVNAVMNPRVP